MLCWINVLNNAQTDKKAPKATAPPVYWAWIYDLNIYTESFATREECIDFARCALIKNKPVRTKTVKNPDKVGEWLQIDV